MRKILTIIAAMAAVLSSCNKNEIEPVSKNDGKDIVLNIRVSNPGADDTKALIKQGWVENDQIKIWFDANTGDTPDLVIKYDGSSKWTQDGTANNVPASGNGYVKAVYNNSVIVASKDNYTFENNTLTFNIANWKFLTEVQVVVKNLTSDKASDYTLACDKFTPLAAGNGYTVGSDAITASAWTKGAAVTGISNTDGVAFVFATADYSPSSTYKQDFKFTLKDNSTSPAGKKVYKPNVAIVAKDGKKAITALTISKDKFTVPEAPEGFVDLGLPSGIFWAEKNLGASSASDYGRYFSWGDIVGQVAATDGDNAFSKSFDWTNDVFGQKWGMVAQDIACPNGVLAPTYDAAKIANSSWRMPTAAEVQELSNNTDHIWTSINSVFGCKFTSKKDSNKYVFFPAAGHGYYDHISNAGSKGNYWSSSLNTSLIDNAYYLDFDSKSVYPTSNYCRYFGYPVRPVSD